MVSRNVVRRSLFRCCVVSVLAASAATSWGQARHSTRTTIAVSPADTTVGQTITLTARVTAAAGPGALNGQVEFDDLAATLGVEYLMLGAQHRFTMAKLLKGNVVERVAAGLPEDIQLIIHG